MQEISALELMAIYKNVSVLDVREMDEYVDGHVPGAKHIPLSMIQFETMKLIRVRHCT